MVHEDQETRIRMDKEIGSHDAKTRLPEILRRVEEGESFTITNLGKPVADLIPSRAGARRRAATAVANLLQFSREHQITDDELAGTKESGRK